jgi:hypothetical protein
MGLSLMPANINVSPPNLVHKTPNVTLEERPGNSASDCLMRWAADMTPFVMGMHVDSRVPLSLNDFLYIRNLIYRVWARVQIGKPGLARTTTTLGYSSSSQLLVPVDSSSPTTLNDFLLMVYVEDAKLGRLTLPPRALGHCLEILAWHRRNWRAILLRHPSM